jgi:hypothetical protein
LSGLRRNGQNRQGKDRRENLHGVDLLNVDRPGRRGRLPWIRTCPSARGRIPE